MTAPAIAPANWRRRNARLEAGHPPKTRSAKVTTGFRWAPDTGPTARMMTASAAAGGGRVLQELEAGVARRQPLGGDPRANDGGDEETSAQELGEDSAAQVGFTASSSEPTTRARWRSTSRPARRNRAELAGGHLHVGQHRVDLPRLAVRGVDPDLVLDGEAAGDLVLGGGGKSLAGQAGRGGGDLLGARDLDAQVVERPGSPRPLRSAPA